MRTSSPIRRQRAWPALLLALLLPLLAVGTVHAGGVTLGTLRSQVVVILDSLGITSGGVYTPPSGGMANPATADLDMDGFNIVDADEVWAEGNGALMGIKDNNGDPFIQFDTSSGLSGANGCALRFSGSTNMNASDVGLQRSAAGVLNVTNGAGTSTSDERDLRLRDLTASGAMSVTGAVTLGNSRYLHTWSAGAAAGITPVGSAAPVFPGFTTRNGRSVLAFDATTLEAVDFEVVVPATYNGGTLTVSLDWVSASATAGAAVLAAQVERCNDGSLDLDSTSFASARSASAATTNATSGVITTSTITFTQSQADGALPGDLVILRVYRDTGDATDTMADDLQLVSVRVRE